MTLPQNSAILKMMFKIEMEMIMKIKLNRIGLLTFLALAGVTAVSAETFYWLPASGTGSWFTATSWNTRTGGDGSNAVPSSADIAIVFNQGVCLIDSGENVVVDRGNVYGNGTDPLPELLIEAGGTLVMSNYFRLGNVNQYGRCTLRGTATLVNNLNDGCAFGGYDNRFANSLGILDIDGGTFNCGSIVGVGDAGTGVVSIINGGTLNAYTATRIGNGDLPTSRGTVTLDNGSWNNTGSLNVGNNGGSGLVEINGGTLLITNKSSNIQIGRQTGSRGSFYLNGGNLKGALVEREPMEIGFNGGTGTFIQNGGTGTVIGVSLGNTGGTGTAIFSNGVFEARATNGSWPAFSIYDDGTLIMAGGTFTGFGSAAAGHLRDGGTLELRDGNLSLINGAMLFTYSNATIRVIGPRAHFDCGWWRNNSGNPEGTFMELILTQDAGHLSRMKSPSSNACAQPGILRVGFDGGICMLSTNRFPYLWAGSHFDTGRVNPSTYGLALWDAAKVDLPTGGDNMQITLKPALSQGTASLPNASITVADAPCGYVNVEGMNTGTLPELTVSLTLTEVDGTLPQILADLQAAGYTNSVLNNTTISIPFAPEGLPSEAGFFAWDFREFDGTTNATVSNVAFIFAAQGTTILLQ